MFRPTRKLPGFADLKTILSQSKKTDDPLYQTIQEIIERLSVFQFDVNTLVDQVGSLPVNPYQVGNWLPTLLSTGGGTAPTYTIQVGKFVRIGSLVLCEFDLTIATVAWTAGTIRLSALPFECDSDVPGSGTLSYFAINTNVYTIDIHLLPGTQTANLHAKTTLSGAMDIALTTASFIAGNRIAGSISYIIG